MARGVSASAEDAVDPERGSSATELGGSTSAAQGVQRSGMGTGSTDEESFEDSRPLEAAGGDGIAAPTGGSAGGAAGAGGTSNDGGSSSKRHGCCACCLGILAIIWWPLAWLWRTSKPARAWIGSWFSGKSYKEVYQDHASFTGKDDGRDIRDFLKDLWTAYAVVVS